MLISKRNRRGIFMLVLFCLLVAITPRVLSAIYNVNEPIISFEEARQIHIEIIERKNKAKENQLNSSIKRFSKPVVKFDPKDYKVQDWEKLGLSKKQSEVVIKFASRGIANESELKRIFVIPNELFVLIKDSVIYAEKEFESRRSYKSDKKRIEIVDINLGSQQDLESLPGIGSYFATKIIEHRNELGGYLSINQLLEIWNFDNEKLDRISPYLKITESVKKIDINQATLDKLKSHPYISYNVANSIVKMRAQNKFISITDIKKSKLIDEELFEKIEPYLKVK